MKKLLYPHLLLLLGLVGSGLFPQWATAQSNPDAGPIRMRANLATGNPEGLEFIDTATGKLLRYLDFAKDGPYGDFDFQKLKNPEDQGYLMAWNLANVSPQKICSRFNIDAKKYKDFYGTDDKCFTRAGLVPTYQINGDYVVVDFQLVITGGKDDKDKRVCQHFLGKSSYLQVFDKTGKVIYNAAYPWRPINLATVTNNGRYLALQIGEIEGDLAYFGNDVIAYEVWDIHSNQMIANDSFFLNPKNCNQTLTAWGPWIICDQSFYNQTAQCWSHHERFMDFTERKWYAINMLDTERNYDEFSDQGYFWVDKKTKNITREILIRRDMKEVMF